MSGRLAMRIRGLSGALLVSAALHGGAILYFQESEVAVPEVAVQRDTLSVEASFLIPAPPPAVMIPREKHSPPKPEFREEIIAAPKAIESVSTNPEPAPRVAEAIERSESETKPISPTPPEASETVTEPLPPVHLPEKPPPMEREAAEALPESAGVEALQPMPSIRYSRPPRYPAAARREGREGMVILLLRIDRKGRVIEADIGRSSGHEDLDHRALTTVRRWQFKNPGEDRLTFECPIDFRLK